MAGLPNDILDEVDGLVALPGWSVHDLRPTTRAVLAGMPLEAVQCVLALAGAVATTASDHPAHRAVHRARVVLACHGQGDPFEELIGLGVPAFAY